MYTNVNPVYWEIQGFFGLGFDVATADPTFSKKGGFSLTFLYLNRLSESECDGLLWKVLDFIDWRL